MKLPAYIALSSLIFGLVALMHALRLALGWEMIFNGYSVPTWASIVGLLVAGYLAYTAHTLKK